MPLPAASEALPGCPSSCGAVDIPYPFGIGRNCSINDSFTLDCNRTHDGTGEVPFQGDVEIAEIFLAQGRARLLNQISSQCYDPTTDSISRNFWYLQMADAYTFSDTLNKFTVLGCQTLAYIEGDKGSTEGVGGYQTGCVAVCHSEGSLSNDTCAGIGCCQTAIPRGLQYYEVSFDADFNTSHIYNFTRCSYAVLMEAEAFQFRSSFITTDDFLAINSGRGVPLMLDWTVETETCAQARRNASSYACKSDNSECLDSVNGKGYLCNCTGGYKGNPYLPNGCQDIDECAGEEDRKPCTGICRNLPGKYECFCPRGSHGNPINGTCLPRATFPLAATLTICITSSIVLLLISSMCIFMIYERKKYVKAKEQHFKEHGGWKLLEEIKGKQGLRFKIFKINELEEATNKFDETRVLGRGGHGTVYKGILEDGHVIAIKKSKFIDESQKNEYGKEMLILSQINHKNIVKILGCCLEVEVPILVYEYVSNGTLHHLIHEKSKISPFSLSARLRIAYDSADALAYLHSTASPPIIHGDVKSSNILLDENYMAKVSDFGASKLVPKDENQLATLVQGTCGYLDPEYLQTCKLTDKSDVYSFGVVLLELLTGKKAIYFEDSRQERNLASTFLLSMKDNRHYEILDNEVKNEGDIQLIQELSDLCKQCLKISGEERPTMKEVAQVLNRLMKFKQHPWIQENNETKILLV
ncbi:hypothetical protein ZIOFF_005931 [Zingiber officinale]|uniref:Protein kinase domain-containing protein n=2 Tax=Zingiber officinale TaxID=94328 RepID=A0A8J5M4P7_ZINOF|nr:hypothetical protein ZIOFF_005931 [Zingiber officinale]